MCPGRHLAELSAFTMMATTLATLNIGNTREANGKETVLEGDNTEQTTDEPIRSAAFLLS